MVVMHPTPTAQARRACAPWQRGRKGNARIGVDGHDSLLKSPGYPSCLLRLRLRSKQGSSEISRQLGTICHPQSMLGEILIRQAHDSDDRTESLFLEEAHLLIHSSHQGDGKCLSISLWIEWVQLTSLRPSILEKTFQSLRCRLVNQFPKTIFT